jgi:hypothetical protein
MRRCHRAMLAATLLAATSALAGCGGSDFAERWADQMQDLLPDFSNKKPLPGERKPVFPEGVPGVPQGVPPELVRGAQTPPEAAGSPTATALQSPAAATPSEEKPKPKKKIAVKPKKVVPPKQEQNQDQNDLVWPAPPPTGWQSGGTQQDSPKTPTQPTQRPQPVWPAPPPLPSQPSR